MSALWEVSERNGTGFVDLIWKLFLRSIELATKVLMRLSPQSSGRRPSVEYMPTPCPDRGRSDRYCQPAETDRRSGDGFR
ncbi:MAG TPA: hypothetical protein VIG24_18710 [Acidimicrobiia bacterium]